MPYTKGRNSNVFKAMISRVYGGVGETHVDSLFGVGLDPLANVLGNLPAETTIFTPYT